MLSVPQSEHLLPVVQDEDLSSAKPRFARAAVARLGASGVDVEVWTVGDGRVAILLALPWAELLVERLELEARSFKEQLRRAAHAEAIRQAEVRAAVAEGRHAYQTEAQAIYASYQRLRGEGHAHAEALRQLRKTDAARIRNLNINSLTALVSQEGTRHRREAQHQAREERCRLILQLRAEGLTTKAIGEQLRLTLYQVKRALRYPRPAERQEGGEHAADRS